ncbi:putative sulfatase [Colletotrichum trifolii]|uniref:Putative sulfatase n=1 Tax=Colletotrichum trifolii TaxID=5466 RepID=A0A4R8QUP2_COLTR|nr:putative sulfatase [Colletotrichum trifolii]
MLVTSRGQMLEHMRRFGDYFKDKPGHKGYLNWRVEALSEILQDVGYHTIMSGKWQAVESRTRQELHKFLPGSGNHHAYEPQLDDDEFKLPTDVPEDFYSTRYFTDRMITLLEERTDAEKEEPCFAYNPFTAPHWPLQAPREVVQRCDEIAWMAQNHEAWNSTAYAQPENTTDLERKESARKMKVFAALVELVDESIGRVIEHLTSNGELDNTFVLFMSDNGAEGAALEAIPMMGGETTFAGVVQKYDDNSLDNMADKASFAWCTLGERRDGAVQKIPSAGSPKAASAAPV